MIWLPGFFTPRLHAIANPRAGLIFHDIPIVWGLCGAPVAVLRPDDTPPLCVECLELSQERRQGAGIGVGRPAAVDGRVLPARAMSDQLAQAVQQAVHVLGGVA